jgi:hypothetical protein
VIWPHKPVLTPKHEREFERVGIDEVRRFLASSRGQYLYITSRPPSSEAKAWVRWKTERDAFWIRTGIAAAICAALLALISCFLTVLAWQLPVAPGK